MLVRSVQRADIHDTNLRQSGTALFLVNLLVFQFSQSLSNKSLALCNKKHDKRHMYSDTRQKREQGKMTNVL